MAKKKDPMDDFDLEKELKGLEALDKEDSNFDFDADFPDIDSTNDRNPIEKQKGIGGKLKDGALLLAGGAAGGIAAKIKESFPETGKLVDEGLNVASDFSQLKYEYGKEIDPIINQTKLITKRISGKLADSGVLPKSLNDKIQRAFQTEDYGGSSTSPEEARGISIDTSLKDIFKVQNMKDDYKMREQRADKFLDRKADMVRHRDTTNLLADIRYQSLHTTAFLTGTYTGYLKKSLELKYKHLFVAQDTLEIMRVNAQNMEAKLEAIRHNTALPDINKEYTTETMKALGKARLINKFQDKMGSFASDIFKNLKDNFLDPIKDSAGMMGDMMEGMEMILDMENEMAEMEGRKPKGFAQHVGGWMGKAAGGILGKQAAGKLFEQHLAPFKGNIENKAASAKALAMWKLNHFRKYGGAEDTMWEDGGIPHMLTESLIPGISSDLGGSENNYLKNMNKATQFDTATRQSIVEIIPGLLSKQLQQLTNLVEGRKDSEELVFDAHSRDFVKQSRFQAEMTDRIFGDKEQRTRAMSGAISSLKVNYLANKGAFEQDNASVTFDDLADQIGKFIFNMGQVKEFKDKWYMELKTIIDDNGSLHNVSRLVQSYFRGIKNPLAVANVIHGSIFNKDGSINSGALNQYQAALVDYTVKFMDEHKDRVNKVIEDQGATRHLKNIFTADRYGNIMVDIDKARDRSTDFDTKILEQGDTTKYALEELKRMDGEKKKANSIIKILFGDKDKRQKFDKQARNLFIELKTLLHDKLSAWGVPEKWLMKLLGKRPEELSPYDIEILTRLQEEEGLNFGPLLRQHEQDQRPDFKSGKGKYKDKKGKDAQRIKDIMESQGVSEDEAKVILKEDQRRKRNQEYGPRGIGDRIRSGIDTTIKLTEDIRDEILKTDVAKRAKEKWNEVKSDLLEEHKKFLEEHPEYEKQLLKFTEDGKKSKQAINRFMHDLVKRDGIDKAKQVAKDKVNEVKEDYVKRKADGASTTEAIRGTAGRQVKQAQNTAKLVGKKAKAIWDGSNVGKMVEDRIDKLSKDTKVYLEEHPELKSQVEEYIKDTKAGVQQTRKYANDLVRNSKQAVIDVVSPQAKTVGGDPETMLGNLKNKADAAWNKISDSTSEGMKYIDNTDAEDLIKTINHATDTVKTKGKNILGEYLPIDTSTTLSDTPIKGNVLKRLKKVANSFIQEEEGSLDVKRLFSFFGKKIGAPNTDATTKVDPKIQHGEKLISMDTSNKKTMDEFIQSLKDQGVLPDEKLKGKKAKGDTTEVTSTRMEDILYEQLLELREISLNTSESAYNGILAAAISSGDMGVLDKILKRPGVLRRAARGVGSMGTDMKEMAKSGIIAAKAKTSRMRKGIKSVGSVIGKVALSPYTIPTTIAKSAVFNFFDIYRSDDLETPLITKSQFKSSENKEEFGDVYGVVDESGKPIKSVYDIKGPVYARSKRPKAEWEELISDNDIEMGIVDKKGRPVNRFLAKLGRGLRKSLGKMKSGSKWGVKKLAELSGHSAVGIYHGIIGAMSGSLGITKAIFNPFPDVYVVGQDLKGGPAAYGKDIEKYGYFLRKGNKVKVQSCYDIDQPVIDGRTDEFMITPDDVIKGLITKKGEPLNKLSTKFGRGIAKSLTFIKDMMFGTLGVAAGGVGMVWNVGSAIVKHAFKKSDPYQDVYTKGFVSPDKVLVYGKDIANRKIVFASNGQIVRSCYDITEPVMKWDEGASDHKRILVNDKDIENGLVNVDGKALSKWNSRSIAGKLIHGGLGAVGMATRGVLKTVGAVGKGVWGAAKGAAKALKKGTEFAMFGSEMIDNLRSSLVNVFGDKKRVNRKDLKEMVSDKLDAIYELLDKRLGKKIKGDTDDNGYVEGSYQDKARDKKEKKSQDIQKKRQGIGDKLAGVAGLSSAASDKGKEEGGGFLKDLASEAGGSLIAKYGGGILSKIPGMGKIAGMGASALGMLGMGGGATAAAGTAAATGATAAAAGAAGTVASGGALAGLGGLIAATPVGWAIGGTLAASALAYGIYKWSTSKSKEEKDLLNFRLGLYGADQGNADNVEALEKRAMKAMEGDGAITDKELESFAKDFGCFDKADVKGSVGFFSTWYQKRFEPTFKGFVEACAFNGIKFKDLDNVTETKVKDIKEYTNRVIRSRILGVEALAPTLAAYQAVKGTTEADNTKTSEKTDLQKEEERKAKEAQDKQKTDEKDNTVKDIKTTNTKEYDNANKTPPPGLTATHNTDTQYAKDPNKTLPTTADGKLDNVAASKISRNVREAMSSDRTGSTGPQAATDLVSSTGQTRSDISMDTFKPGGTSAKFSEILKPTSAGKATVPTIPGMQAPSMDTSTAPSTGTQTPGVSQKGTVPGTDTTTKASPGGPQQSSSQSLSTGSYQFGKQTAKMEAGGNPGMVSSGDKWGDPGGVSYGKYQFASKAKIPEKFMDSPLSGKYGQMLKEAGPVNSPEFKKKWQELGKDPGFEAAQDAYGKKMYLDDNVKKYPWVANKSPMVQEAIMHAYMGSGNQGKHMMDAINKAGGDKLSDKEILQLMDKEYKANIGKTKGFWVGQNKDATFLKKYDEQQRVLLAAQEEYDKNKAAQQKSGGPENTALGATPGAPGSTPTDVASNAPSGVQAPSGPDTTKSQAASAPGTTSVESGTDFSKTPKDVALSGNSGTGTNKSGQTTGFKSLSENSFNSTTIPQAGSSPAAAAAGAPQNVVGTPTTPGQPGAPGQPAAKPAGDPNDGFKKLKPAGGDVDLAGLAGPMKSAIGAANAEFMAKYGKPMAVTSAKRSLEKQAALYQKLGPSQAAKPNPNAPHVRGVAVDINTPDANKAAEAGILSKYGLSRPLWPQGKGKVKPEPWHIQLTGTPPESAPEQSDGKEPDKSAVEKSASDMATSTPAGAPPGTPAPGDPSLDKAASGTQGSDTGTDTSTTSAPGTTSVESGTDFSKTPSDKAMTGNTGTGKNKSGQTTGFKPISEDEFNNSNLPGMNANLKSTTPTMGTNTPGAAAPQLTEAMNQSAPAAADAGGSSAMLEQLKLIASILSGMDKNVGTMAGWDLGNKLGEMAKSGNTNTNTGDPSGKSASNSGDNGAPTPVSNTQKPNPPAAEPNPDKGRPVSPPFKFDQPTSPIAVRRNGKPPLQV